MVDPRDLGLVTQVRSPHSEAPTIYLYEAVPGRDRPVRAAVRSATTSSSSGRRRSSRPAAATRAARPAPGPRLDPEVNGKALALRLLAALDGAAAADRGVGRSAARLTYRSYARRACSRRLALDDLTAGPTRRVA